MKDKDKDKKKAQLIKELKKLRRRINNATTNVKSVQVNRRRITDHQYRVVIDAMADAIHVVDRDLRLILFNKAFKKWNKQLQLKTDVIGKKIFDVFPFLPKHIGKEYDYIFKTGKILITEEATEIKGNKFITETRKIPILEDGDVVRIVTIIRNITERKRVEDALRESERKYKTLMQTSPDAVVVSNLKTKITTVSERACVLYGCDTTEELLGKNSFELIAQKDRKRAMKNLEIVVKQGSIHNVEYTLLRKDGTTFFGEMSASLIRDAQGKPKAFVATIRDIAERKQAEQSLRESEEKYKTLTENINVGIYRNTTGPKGRFIEANPAIIRIFGYDNKEEFLKIDVADLYQNSRDRKNYNKKMLRDGFVSNEEERLKKKDGASIICSVSAVAIKDDKGKVKYYDGIVEDITERKRSEQSLRNHSAQLERILEETVVALASTLGKRDPYTGGHQERVTSLACAIAKEMELSEEMIKGIRLAGLLHDIGKIATPAEILSKPSSLTDAEFNIVKYHPRIGYEILKSIEFPWPIAKIVLQHHELLDGSGYPQGLKNGEIRIEAKIMVVADVVEAMSSHRPYRPAHSLKVTLAEINKYKGILYEPEVVDVCLGLFSRKKFRFSNKQRLNVK